MNVPAIDGRPARRRRLLPLAKLSLALMLGASLLIPTESLARRASSLAAAPAGTTAPNIVFIVTDDQRWDTLWAMPNVQSELIGHGVDFSNSFAVNALCCPARTTILKGQYSHSTLVYDNAGPYGGFHAFHGDDSTIATWLSGGGYRTGLLGKYLNGYNVPYVPPGWSYWAAFQGASQGGAYYNYDLNVNNTIVHYGNTPADYSTDVLAGYADSFIRTTQTDQPLFLYLSFKAPHVPTTPAAKYANEFEDLLPYRPPNYNERDVSDKPAWVQGLRVLAKFKRDKIDMNRIKQYQTFLSVDDAVGTVMTALSETGRLGNTMIVYTSDQGWSLGEHRWNNKKVAYEESIRTPLVVRYDPLVTTPRTDQHLIANIDFAPTFAELGGVQAPGVEGLSFMPLIESPSATWRTDFLIEHLQGNRDEIPTFCSVRNEGYLYVMYATEEEELYDLAADFYELTNVATDPDYAAIVTSMRNRMKTLCDPPPPGFTP